jgi:FkbM family methyltransferase
MSGPRERRALLFGVATTMTAKEIVRLTRPDLVIDVGANRGQFCLAVASAADGARIVAIEPIPTEADRLRRVMSGYASLTVIECAVGARAGIADLHLSSALDSSSLLAMTSLQEELFPATHPAGVLPVEVRTLDEIAAEVPIGQRTLLKVDVQGCELQVFEGAPRTLARTLWVWCEVSFVELYVAQPLAGDVVAFLYRAGFRLASVGEPVRARGRSVQVDLLFKRER